MHGQEGAIQLSAAAKCPKLKRPPLIETLLELRCMRMTTNRPYELMHYSTSCNGTKCQCGSYTAVQGENQTTTWTKIVKTDVMTKSVGMTTLLEGWRIPMPQT